MAVIKVACPKCGQKVSGDDSFFGSSVECPVCTSQIIFPPNPNATEPTAPAQSDPPLPRVDDADIPPSSPPALEDTPEYTPVDLPPADGGFDDVPRKREAAEATQDLPTADQSSGYSAAPPKLEDESAHQEPPAQSRRQGGDSDEEGDVPSPALGATSLVLGILGIVSCLFAAILASPGAIICGHIALAKAKHSPVQPAPGRNLAFIGTILGYAGMVLLLIALVVLAIFGPGWKEMAETGA